MSEDQPTQSTPASPEANDQTVHEFEPQPPDSGKGVAAKTPRKTPRQPRPEPFSRAYIAVSAIAVVVFFGLLVGFAALIAIDMPWAKATRDSKPSSTKPSDSQTRAAGGGT